jgi:hemoglobin
MTIYERIGGEGAVNLAVDIFYKKVLIDDRVNQFFDFIDMPTQIDKQKKFLAMAFSGPNHYSGKDMREAHKNMHLTEAHFSAVAENLVDTLNELNVPQDLIDEILDLIGSVKGDVLNQ